MPRLERGSSRAVARVPGLGCVESLGRDIAPGLGIGGRVSGPNRIDAVRPERVQEAGPGGTIGEGAGTMF